MHKLTNLPGAALLNDLGVVLVPKNKTCFLLLVGGDIQTQMSTDHDQRQGDIEQLEADPLVGEIDDGSDVLHPGPANQTRYVGFQNTRGHDAKVPAEANRKEQG